MDNQSEHQQNSEQKLHSNEFVLNEPIVAEIKELSRWSRYYSLIMIAIMTVSMLISIVTLGIMVFNLLSDGDEGFYIDNSQFIYVFVFLVYILLFGLGLFIHFKMLNFSKFTQKFFRDKNPVHFEVALNSMKTSFKLSTILLFTAFCIYVVIAIAMVFTLDKLF